jgi:hypothetical protein
MSEEKQKQPITTGQIAVGVAGGIALFIVGVGVLQTIKYSVFGGPELQSFNKAVQASNEKIKAIDEEWEQKIRECNGTCATVTGETLSRWPLTTPAPVIATCKGDHLFLKANNQWYERSEKPDSDYPSWKVIQKKNGIWPFQYGVNLKFLEEEINKACQS